MRNILSKIKRIYKSISGMFRKVEDIVEDVNTRPLPELLENKTQTPLNVGIFVGHSRQGDKGAVSVGGVSEWAYNVDLAQRLYVKLNGIGHKCEIISDYNASTYGNAMRNVAQICREKKFDVAIELHFNSATATANGYEYLYWHTSTNGKRLAQAFIGKHQSMLPNMRSRGAKPLGANSRGALFVRLTPCPAIILEPFFGSNWLEWTFYSDNEGKETLSEIYMAAIEDYSKM